jgi:hypothetical protein
MNSLRLGKRQRCGIDAITQPSRTGAIRKDVPKMAAAASTGYFNATHAIAQVFMFDDSL